MRACIRFRFALAMLAALSVPLLLPADVLVMKDGKTIEGEVTEQADVYEVKTPFGVLKVDKADVAQRVSGPGAMAAEAETLRVTAKAMIDGATAESNPTLKARTLGAAVEILQKALETYTKAREIFKGEKYAHLDKASAEVIREIAAAKEKMPATPAPQPAAPSPAGGNQPLAGDLLAPPPPPSSLAGAKIAPPTPTRFEGVQEGESLTIQECTGGKTRVQQRSPRWRGPWSGDEQLWWTGGKEGDALTVVFRSDDGGRKTLVLGLVNASDYGIVRVIVNGDVVRESIDLYATAVIPAPVELPVRLEEGRNRLKFKIVGANPASRGTLVGLDYVAVRPASASLAGGGMSGLPGVPETPPVPDPAAADTPAGKLLAEARDFVDRKRTSDALRVLKDLFKKHRDDPAAVAALPLFNGLKHPDGRMICGFDTPEDLGMWRLHGSRYTSFTHTVEPIHIHEGIGAARITSLRTAYHSTGAICLELGKFDVRRFRGLTISVFQARPSLGRFEIAFIRGNQRHIPWISDEGDSEIGACFYWATPLKFVGWRKFKISAQQFKARGSGGVSGKIGWHDVGALVIYDAARRGMDIAIDSLRFIEIGR
jgi:hypothetical protein